MSDVRRTLSHGPGPGGGLRLLRSHTGHVFQEFIRFLNAIEAEIPAGKIIHVILDNYGSHKHPKVRAWLDRHPRFVFHYTPTSASWLNAVSNAARSTRSSISRRPSSASSPRPMTIPGPSSGPPTPIRSSPPSDVGTKR